MRLILVPTAAELRTLRPFLSAAVGHEIRVELCGFGPIAAAARAATLIEQWHPDRVLLLGIAGTFVSRLPVGTAHSFERVACHGVGRGSGDAFVSAAQMGWPQWSDTSSPNTVGDELPLVSECEQGTGGHLLLTACSASGSAVDAECRLKIFPEASAEDMEGYGVALACRMVGVELQVVRGISNQVGECDRRQWQVEPALEAAGWLAQAILRSET